MTTTVITGANRGIGLALCQQACGRGDEVIAVCRSNNEDLDRLGVRVESGIDVAQEKDVNRLVDRLAGTGIDILINNAGILSRQSLENLDFAAIRQQFEVNSLGPLRVTAALQPKLNHGAKVAIVTSRMGSVADNTSGSHYGYRMSKAAVNMAGMSLAHDLREQGISVVLLHPGFVATEMVGNRGDVQPQEAARGLLARIEELSLQTSGRFMHANGEELPW